MAELQGSTAIQPTAVPSGDYALQIVDFSASGVKETLAVPLPKDEKWGNVMLRAAILKRTTWKAYDIPTVIHAVVYADQMGLDIMVGDVYMATEGRLSTTAGAKIRHAMGTGRVVGYRVTLEDGPAASFPWKTKNDNGTWEGPDYKATVTVFVKDWVEPVVYETTLSEWFKGENPNWRIRPKYMLRLNALGKALAEVAPMGVEADEAPPEAPAGVKIAVAAALAGDAK